MKKGSKKLHRYDISLQEGAGAGLITWISALMVFFVALSLGAWFTLSTVSKEWVTDLSGNLTVEIKPSLQASGKASDEEPPNTFTEKTQKVLLFVRQHQAIQDARLVDAADVKTLIEPWLGHTLSAEIPLPALIDARLKKDADLSQFKKDLHDVFPEAVLDTHDDTLQSVKSTLRTIQIFTFLLAAIVIGLATVTISGIVRAKFSIHRQEVETLHLIGASDEYIARQFRHHTLAGSLKGALTGLLGFILAVGLLAKMTVGLDTDQLKTASTYAFQWGVLIIAAPLLISSIIAHLTAQVSVMRELAKMP